MVFWSTTSGDDGAFFEQDDDDDFLNRGNNKNKNKNSIEEEDYEDEYRYADEEANWQMAHTKTCKSLQSLVASRRQVVDFWTAQQDDSVQIPFMDQVELWETTTTTTNKEMIERMATKFQNCAAAAASTTASSSSLTTMTTRAIWGLASAFHGLVIGGGNDNHDDDEHIQQVEDGDEYHMKEKPVLGWEMAVLNSELTMGIYRQILQQIHNNDDKQNEDDDMIVISDFTQWCRQQEQNDDNSINNNDLIVLLTHLPQDQIEFLFNIMLHLGHAKKVQVGENDDGLIVLLGNHDGKDISDTRIQVAATKYRIERAMESTQANMTRWSNQIKEATQKALSYKQKGLKKQAVMELKRKAMIEQHLHRSEQILYNLEVVLLTLETSKSQTQVVKALKDSSQTLSNMYNGGLSSVDDVVLDLQEEMARVQDATRATATDISSMNGDHYMDEEELLRELAQDSETLGMTTTATLSEEEEAKDLSQRQSPANDKTETPTATASFREEAGVGDMPEAPQHTPVPPTKDDNNEETVAGDDSSEALLLALDETG